MSPIDILWESTVLLLSVEQEKEQRWIQHNEEVSNNS